jgi:drug/metabolite transporter (DMT)-like permease
MTQAKGRLLALGAGVCFGTLGTLSKLFYNHGGHPFELLVIRLVAATVVFGAIAGTVRSPRPPRRTIVLALGLGAFQASLNIALLVGYQRAPVALVALLFYVYPLLATLGETVFFGQTLGLRKVLVVALGLAGISLTIGAPSSAPAVGIVLGVAAAFGTAAYILGSRHVMTRGVDPIQFLVLSYLGPATGFLVAVAFRGFHTTSNIAYGYAALLALVSTVLASILFYGAVRFIGAGTTSLLCSVDPLVSVVLAYVVLGESLSATQLAGGSLILTSVVALTLPQRRRSPSSAAPSPRAAS